MNIFDQIMPLNSVGNEVSGYINALNEEFYIQLSVQESKQIKKIRLSGCEKLQKLLKPVQDDLEQIMQLRSTAINQTVDLHMGYNLLLEQLQAVGWDKVHYISSDFQSVHLKAIDEFDREHILKLWIPEKFPKEPPRYEYDLPEVFDFKWLPDDTFSTIFSAFQEVLMKHSEFWDNLDEIDAKTWVLEPENPKRSDCKRRIAISSGVSLLLLVDPARPTAVPTCSYLGPDRIVEPVREKFNSNIHLWSEYNSLLYNLKQVLEIEFPSPESATKEEFCMECGICYSYHLGDAVPTMNCDNSSCNQMFHHSCLYEYIRMLPDVRTSFNKLFGECPYCSKPLWCTVP
ncbi:E3 ubiquitin-protein ligase FANCL-like isoform X2 [Uloborus diversus]|uniref:E3 ubiquitin-protein ligase FANCL-like isoform X2 n=1 Tax=Uloborus diversus TaxID=327109 RepID=UPI002409B943|nr:E3 ubiquitin-protein ligase FANCL-like isoform X2 [Uloborus diversus]